MDSACILYQGSLNKKEISIFIFNELYLFA